MRAYSYHFKVWLLFTPLLLCVVACAPPPKEEQICRLVPLAGNSPESESSTQLDDAINGTPHSVVIQNDYAYVGFEASFIILDVSNPVRPQEVSSIPLPVSSMDIISNYAFLRGDNLRIFDVSRPDNPTEVHCQNNAAFEFSNAVIDGKYAYLSQGKDGLRIIDASNPSLLVETSSYLPWSSPQIRFQPNFKVIKSQPRLVLDVAVHNKYIYVAESLLGPDSLYDGSIGILDMTKPSKPKLVGSYEMPNNVGVQKLMLNDNHLLATASYMDTPAIVLLDVTDPINPVEKTLPDVPGGLVAVSGDHAYFATGSPGLQVWDMSDPATPIRFTWDDLHYGYTTDLAISPPFAYFTTQYGGFRIVDITDPAHPVTISKSFD